jgi:LmbE family N-acetylglucosaminyl deacetylase
MGIPRIRERTGVIPLIPGQIRSVAAIGAHCDDIAIGAGATLMALVRKHPQITLHVLILTGGGTERETEEKNAFAALCPSADVRLTVADLTDGRLPAEWTEAKRTIAAFRAECEPDVVFGPQSEDRHQDHRVVAELIPTEFRAHLILGYEILKWESDLPNPTTYLPVSTDDARKKTTVLAQCYRSQLRRDWFDAEAFLGLMRIRGVQCHSRYAEAFTVDKAVLGLGDTTSSG